MNRSTAAGIARAVLLVVLAGTGGYLLLYLYRWEWQRAIVSGIFFLAALIALCTILVLRRLDRIERRSLSSAPPAAPAYAANASASVPVFPFLEPRDSYGVFIPILLGFGAVVGLIAVAVERIASFVGGGSGVREPVPSSSSETRNLGASRGGRAAAIVLLALAVAGVVVLRSLTMYAPEEPKAGERDLTVSMSERRIDANVVNTTKTLLDYCVAATGVPLTKAAVRPLDDQQAKVTLSPRLDEVTQRRLNGCLEDLVLDRRLLNVVAMVDRVS